MRKLKNPTPWALAAGCALGIAGMIYAPLPTSVCLVIATSWSVYDTHQRRVRLKKTLDDLDTALVERGFYRSLWLESENRSAATKNTDPDVGNEKPGA